jgi:ubiquinone/menaquinone biosynthesis C-methylase UbiE
MEMDLRLTFNEDAPNYDRLRPTYADELYDDVIYFSNLNSTKKALEIGIGTGQATLPFLKTGCNITAIEIGDKLAQFSREKFKAFKNVEVFNQNFESAQLDDNTYDLIYSASAFHWIPQEIGLPKVYRLLKSGGVFAWFSIQPAPVQEQISIHEAFQKIYGTYSRYLGDKPLPGPQECQQLAENKRLKRFNLLKQYGFVDVNTKFYYGKRIFNAKDYTTLISTYSNHKAIPEDVRIPFLKEITDTIDHSGGKFTLSDTIILCMGRKP